MLTIKIMNFIFMFTALYSGATIIVKIIQKKMIKSDLIACFAFGMAGIIFSLLYF